MLRAEIVRLHRLLGDGFWCIQRGLRLVNGLGEQALDLPATRRQP